MNNNFIVPNAYLGHTKSGDELIKIIYAICFLTYSVNKAKNLKGINARTCEQIISTILKDTDPTFVYVIASNLGNICQIIYNSCEEFTGSGMSLKEIPDMVKKFITNNYIPF